MVLAVGFLTSELEDEELEDEEFEDEQLVLLEVDELVLDFTMACSWQVKLGA